MFAEYIYIAIKSYRGLKQLNDLDCSSQSVDRFPQNFQEFIIDE
jgi:hypothetical protein